MLTLLSRAIERRHKLVLVVAVGFVLLGGVTAAGVGQHLGTGGFYAPADESTRADAAFESKLPAGPHNLVVVARAEEGVDSRPARLAGERLTEFLLGEQGISSVVSYWPSAEPALRSSDRHKALVLARIDGDEDQRKATLLRIYPRLHGEQDGLTLTLGGQPAIEREVTERSQHDLHRMELLATPVVAVILLLVFGSLVSSMLPLIIGLTAIVGAMVTLRLIALVTDVSLYSLNIATALSLGLAIDYGLFMVTRYREELDTGVPVSRAVATTISTAGRTVLFSALTVALSLSSLLVFPLYYLRSFAYAGIAVVGFAALSALVLLPAALLLLGHHVDRWDVVGGLRRLRSRERRSRRHRHLYLPRHRVRPSAGGRLSRTGAGRWHRLAVFVMRRPVPLALLVVTVLVVLGSPFLGARFALPDETSLPEDSDSTEVVHLLRAQFPELSTDAMYVVSAGQRLTPAETGAYAQDVSGVSGVAQVQSSAGTFAGGRLIAPPSPQAGSVFDGPDASWLSVALRGDPQDAAAGRTVAAVRALDTPAPMLVGGTAAHLVDTEATLGRALPAALAIVAVSTLALLFLFTGSVLIPVKAVVLNLLSLTATFGAAVWIFQDGNLRWLLGDFQTNGAIELTTPILLFAVAFGLSMDYELFLLSRIKEEYARLGDNTAAVAAGLERTGRLVTYAALLFVIVMVAFATSQLSVLKLVGVGLGLAVAMDATLIRAILVPAFMRLAGRANWWAPAPLRALHDRIGLHEGTSAPVTAPARRRRTTAVLPLHPTTATTRSD
jgi:RND superfamily putative drug exporter